MTIETHSPDETIALGRVIGECAQASQVIALHGQLGAGKTHLVRGIAEGARVADPDLVASPTFVILNIYPRDERVARARTVFHLDAYRTHGEEDFAAVGLDELLSQDGIVVVEWAAKIPELLPPDHLAIGIDPLDETTRAFFFTPTGPQSARLAGRVCELWNG